MAAIVNWGPSTYPTTLDTVTNYPNLVDFTNDVIADHPMALRDAVIALEAKLGITGGDATGFGSIGFSGIAASPGNNTIWISTATTPNRLYYTNSVGTDINIDTVTSTLDEAYDAGGSGLGKAVTADSGAITITIPDTSNNSAISIVNNDVTNTPDSLAFSGTVTSHAISSTSSLNFEALNLNFQDQYRAGSTWTATHIPFSGAIADWDTYESNFGEVSLLNALNQAVGASAGGSDAQVLYNDGGSINGTPHVSYDDSQDTLMIQSGTSSTTDHWASADTSLTISNDSGPSNVVNYVASSTSNLPYYSVARARGTLASPTAVQSGDTLGSFQWVGVHTAGSWANNTAGVELIAEATENWSSSQRGASLEIKVIKNGDTSSTSRYRINGDGSQEFLYDGTNAAMTLPSDEQGIRLGTGTSDPTGVDGQMYYKSDTHEVRTKINGSWLTVTAT